MSETTFSKGDRVKVTADHPPYIVYEVKGEVGTVTEVQTYGRPEDAQVYVALDRPHEEVYHRADERVFYYPRQLEHLDEAPAFQVGDRVRVTVLDRQDPKGQPGTIVENEDADPHYPFAVEFDRVQYGTAYYDAHELVPHEEGPTEEAPAEEEDAEPSDAQVSVAVLTLMGELEDHANPGVGDTFQAMRKALRAASAIG